MFCSSGPTPRDTVKERLAITEITSAVFQNALEVYSSQCENIDENLITPEV